MNVLAQDSGSCQAIHWMLARMESQNMTVKLMQRVDLPEHVLDKAK
jgi:hypothetical protein